MDRQAAERGVIRIDAAVDQADPDESGGGAVRPGGRRGAPVWRRLRTAIRRRTRAARDLPAAVEIDVIEVVGRGRIPALERLERARGVVRGVQHHDAHPERRERQLAHLGKARGGGRLERRTVGGQHQHLAANDGIAVRIGFEHIRVAAQQLADARLPQLAACARVEVGPLAVAGQQIRDGRSRQAYRRQVGQPHRRQTYLGCRNLRCAEQRHEGDRTHDNTLGECGRGGKKWKKMTRMIVLPA